MDQHTATSALVDHPQHPGIAPGLPAQMKTTQPPGIGGGERDRTDDPLLAKQVLSQLSYTPA
jgi:hypothetical protein